jgi:YD repeat-containing protein
MKIVPRRIAACRAPRWAVLLCGVSFAFFTWSSVAYGARQASSASEGSLLGGSLSVPGVDTLDGGEQARAQRAVRLAAPGAFFARWVSQSAYENLGVDQARSLVRRTFPQLVDMPAGGPPLLPAGERIVSYAGYNAARVVLPGHKRGVVETLEPIARRVSRGRYEPLDLGLRDVGAGFQPVRSLVGVRISRRLNGGVRLMRGGVSLTPVDSRGVALGGSQGQIDGAGVIFANSLLDGDTFVKPIATGVSEETVLRSVRSPRELFFRVGMPAGARLVAARDGSGSVDIVVGRTAVVVVSSPVAHDAEGTLVPVSMGVVSRDLLRLTVAPFAGSYRLPIVVDPTATDLIFQNVTRGGESFSTEWHFEHSGNEFKAPEHPEGGSWTETIGDLHGASDWGRLSYTTHGESQIIKAVVRGHWNNTGSNVVTNMVLSTGSLSHREAYSLQPEDTEIRWPGQNINATVCAPELKCAETVAGSAPPENNNTASYWTEAVGLAEKGKNGTDTLVPGGEERVEISQEKSPEISFNTTSPTIHNESTHEYVPNVLYGSGGWLGPHNGAYEERAKDPGTGISLFRTGGNFWGYERPFYATGEKCFGVQCPESVNQGFLYNDKMVDGEEGIETLVEDAAGLYATILPKQKIKVDATPPHDIKLSGLVNGNELPLGESRIKVEATDGEGSIPSSGIKSITVSVDGQAVPGSSAYCSPGKCTASTEVMLAARNYSSGQHTLVVTATDNANNVEQEEYVFRVRGASPVSVGPGSVDPSTGELTLSANDVSLGGGSGVSRTYQSRHLTAGAEGPLGPQWAINMGGSENLTIPADGNAVLTASGGSRTVFTLNSKGEFESPKGDSNLKLEAKEKEPGKGITEYVLSNPTAATKTRFEQPVGTQSAPPVFVNQFGAEAPQLNHPVSDAIDSSEDVWVTSYQNDLIEKFSQTGTLLATYGSYGTEGGQYRGPWGIAIDPHNGNVYVTDQGNNRIEELSSAGVFSKAFGWGVSDGKSEFETCTTKCKPGIAGAGNGQFNVLAGLSVDSSGNLWVADYGNNRIQEFNEKGEYQTQFGSTGKEAGKFEGPMEIALSGGNLYVTDYNNNRVQEFSTTGSPLRQFGEAGSENGKFSHPNGIASDSRNGNLYVIDSGNARVQEFTSTGGFITKFGSSGKGEGQFVTPNGIAVDSLGDVFAIDNGANQVDEWMRPAWVPVEAGGPLAASATTYAYEAVEVEPGKTGIEPTEALAPVPAGVACGTKLSELKETKDRGCRALTFNYASSTTATGENQSEWGDYKGHLTRAYFHAWDPSKGAMTETEVAHYLYDKQGRLRTEWDPRISPALKIVYGYDVEGHVTALTQPGLQPWVFTYGTIAGDANTGRLLKVAQAHPKAGETEEEVKKKLGEEKEAPTNTEAPKLSGSAVVGTMMGVTNGTWSNSPVAYGYQWKDCNAEGKECTPIPGATNSQYAPTLSDAGHTLVAAVSAGNGGGASVVMSAASSEVKAAEVYSPSESSAANTHGIIAGPDGNLWFTAYGYTKLVKVAVSGIGKITTSGTFTEYILPGESKPYGITEGADHNLWFTEYGSNRIGKITTSGTVSEYSLPASSEPRGITAGPDGNLWFANSGTNKIGKITTSGTVTEYSLPSGSFPEGIVTGSDDNLWFTESRSNRIGKITTSGTVSEYSLPASSEPVGITAGPDHNLWFTDYGTNRIGKITTAGAITEYALPTHSSPIGITTGPDHNLWFTDSGTHKIGMITTTGAVTEGSVSVAEPYGITVGPDSNLWFTDSNSDKIGKIALNPSSGDPHPQPGSTIEYRVPVSGEGAPHNMSKEEVEKWGQKDTSVEGVAVFPPDEPQGWPASDYKRATLHYWDAQGRMVNTATPSGGISTSEYNESSEVVRALSADNRAAALKEGAKSAEVAEKLDTKSKYSEDESELLETVGPEHKVKLSNGSEVQARNQVRYAYDHNAPEGKHYGLVTETTDAALTGSKEEDKRTTVTSYSGQEDLGWKLRKPTSTTTDPSNLDLVHKTFYDKNTGNVIETRAPAGNSEHVSPPYFSLHFGGSGSGDGQFKEPWAVALDSTGSVWALDTGNGRVEKFSATGGFIGAYGKAGTGDLEFKEPHGIAVNQTTGNVYVADGANNRIEELSSSGGFVEVIGWGVSNEKAELEVCKASCKAGIAGSGKGQFGDPQGLTIDSEGNVWVTDAGNDRVEAISEGGAFLSQFGSKGSGNGQLTEPYSLAISEGSVYVVDHGNDRVEQFSMSGAYLGQFGSKGTGAGQFTEPYGIAANQSTGVLYVCDTNNQRMQEFSPAGKFLTQWNTWGSTHQQSYPRGVAVGSTGDLYIIDKAAAEIGEWIPPEAGGAQLSFGVQFGSKGSGEGQFSEPGGAAIDGKGDVWIADYANDRIEEFSPQGKFLVAYGKEGSGEVQFKGPTRLAINKSTGDVYITDTGSNRVEELSTTTGKYVASFGTSGLGTLKEPVGDGIDSSGDVWVADRGNDRIVEFSSTGTYMNAYGKEGSGELQFKEPDGIGFSGEDVYVTDSANHRVEVLTTSKGAYVRAFGFEGDGSGELFTPEGIAVDAAGNLYVSDENAGHVEEFSPSGAFKATFGAPGTGEGQFTKPIGEAIDPAGDLYVVDTGDNRVELWDSNQQAAHDVKTFYYTAKEESEAPGCRNHPEWADLPCQVEPAAQPNHGLPELPVATVASYNIWDGAEKTEEKFGSGSKAVVRTKTQTYDPAGRALTSEVTSSPVTGMVLPKVTNEYNPETGALEKQSALIKSETKTITNKMNTLGQLVEYTDAEKATTKYMYDIDGRVEEVSDSKGTQMYSYDATTGGLTKLLDSAAGTFTAEYDVEGKMTNETYPNGMNATYTYDPSGTATGMEYTKTAHCAKICPEAWFGDTIVPSIHGETLSQTSTLAKESYAYDNVGRLTQTQEEPAGKGCKTRVYAYDEEANRTSLTSREPGIEGKCASEGGMIERHTYDEANRLTDASVTYETFGNTTKLPASDAGEHEMTNTYYVDSQLAAQTQNGETINYFYDPAGRTMETVSEGKSASKMISHYAGPGEALAWTSEEEGKKWTRNIPGIDGTLTAVQKSGENPILQLHDLQGNVVATASVSESETKLLSTYNRTEFGVPQPGTTPPKYAWLGATGLSTEPAQGSGAATQGGASYVPLIGRPLQTGPIASPGAFPDGTGGYGIVQASYSAALDGLMRGIDLEYKAGLEKAKAQEAREQAERDACPASECHVNGPGEGNCEPGECVTGGEGEGYIGDPVKCKLKGRVSLSHGTLTGEGWANCEGTIPAHSELQVCLQTGFPGEVNTYRTCIGTEHASPADFMQIGRSGPKLQCVPGEIYVVKVRIWTRGSPGVIRFETPEFECEDPVTEATDEVFGWLAPAPK